MPRSKHSEYSTMKQSDQNRLLIEVSEAERSGRGKGPSDLARVYGVTPKAIRHYTNLWGYRWTGRAWQQFRIHLTDDIIAMRSSENPDVAAIYVKREPTIAESRAIEKKLEEISNMGDDQPQAFRGGRGSVVVFSDAEMKELDELASAGFTADEMAQRFVTTPKVIKRKLGQLGYHSRQDTNGRWTWVKEGATMVATKTEGNMSEQVIQGEVAPEPTTVEAQLEMARSMIQGAKHLVADLKHTVEVQREENGQLAEAGKQQAEIIAAQKTEIERLTAEVQRMLPDYREMQNIREQQRLALTTKAQELRGDMDDMAELMAEANKLVRR